MSILCLCLSLFLGSAFCSAVVTLTPVVKTSTGPIQGSIHTYDGTTVHVFKGIPYAAPPVGDLRFAPPQVPQPWTEPLETVEYKNRCLQETAFDSLFYFPPRVPPPTDEDCLHLSVVVPKSPSMRPMAVMVYIHGGGLNAGSSADISPEALAIAGDVIVVSINYRLNVFGFLASEDESAPGNVGFLDQVLALKWIQDNIAAFEGDPERITIFGISAGSWSVSAHMVSPLSKGLFKRGISQSGSLYAKKLDSRSERAPRNAKWAEALGCSAETEDAVLSCLRKASATELLALASKEFVFEMNSPATFGDEFLPVQVTELYDGHQIHEGVEYIIGTCKEEGALGTFMVAPLSPDQLEQFVKKGIAIDDPHLKLVLDFITLHTNFVSTPEEKEFVKSLITNQYFPKLNDRKIGNMRQLIDAFSDVVFVAPTVGTVRKTAEAGNKVYQYVFNQTPSQRLDTFFPQLHLSASSDLDLGAIHALDGFYMFAEALVPGTPEPTVTSDKFSPQDISVAKSMVYAWSTFAKSGIAEYLTEDGEALPWPQFDNDEEQYLVWKHPLTSSSLKKRFRPAAADFWNTLLPAAVANIPDETEDEEHPIKDEL